MEENQAEPGALKGVCETRCTEGMGSKQTPFLEEILLMEGIHQLIRQISNSLQCFKHFRWCRISEPSTVWKIFSPCLLQNVQIPFQQVVLTQGLFSINHQTAYVI